LTGLSHGQGDGFIDKIKLTILEVYPDRQYEDTAITEFYVGGFPDTTKPDPP
jgi:hypothetical protein